MNSEHPFFNYFKENIEWLKSFVSETYENRMAGKASSRRMMELAVIWTFIFSYVKIGIAKQDFQPLDWTWAVMIAGILGLKSLDVYAQRKADNTSNGNGKTPPPPAS